MQTFPYSVEKTTERVKQKKSGITNFQNKSHDTSKTKVGLIRVIFFLFVKIVIKLFPDYGASPCSGRLLKKAATLLGSKSARLWKIHTGA